MMGLTQKALLRHCPCCKSAQGEVLHHTKFALIQGVPLTDHYDVVSCSECGFCFADTVSGQADYDAYYSMHSKYEDATTSTGSALSPVDAARLNDLAERLTRLVPNKSARIADIGCANGGLLGALHALGYTDLTGIDPSPACAHAVDAKPGLHGIAGSFSTLPNVQPFDVIILTGVLEHVRDVAEAVQSLRPILAPSGLIYVTVPDAARYVDYIFAPFQDFNTEHINHFSAKTLANLMQRQGYEQLASEAFLSHESADLYAPAILGLFRQNTAITEQPIQADRELKQLIEQYSAASQAMMDQLEQQFASYFAEHEKLIVWGTGQLALKLLASKAVDSAKISAFVDGNPINQGSTLLGKPILAPAQISDMAEPILLTTTLHHAAIKEKIRSQLHMQNPVLKLTLAN